MRCNISKYVPKSITDFKINHKQTWKELINHNFLTHVLTLPQETLTDASINSWYEFVTQSQFRKNLVKHNLKNPNRFVTENSVESIDFKKCKDKFWKLHGLEENDVKTSSLNRTTLSWYLKLVNGEDRAGKLAILVNVLGTLEACSQHKYFIEKLNRYEYDMYDYEHNNLLESKLKFVSDNSVHSVISKVIKAHRMQDLLVQEAGDIGRIYDAVDANIEFLDQFIL